VLDLVYSVDVIHHVSDKSAYYHEVARVLKPGGQVCTVTDSADIIRQRENLSAYFPETVEVEMARYPRIAQLQAAMAAVGLLTSAAVTVSESYELTDTQPFRDKAYSSLHLISERAWKAGLAQMERDLVCGPIRGMSRYTCLWGSKPRGNMD
jgi:ubiquinone/menaquinone biosynthesis C-methylase UbiE